MALLAESLVEEWLNRKGFFTIRGLKQDVDEIDLLAVAHRGSSVFEACAFFTLNKIMALGRERTEFPVLGHTLPPSAGVDGLLGWTSFGARA